MRAVATRQDGFTLLELLIALVILAMMAAVGLEAFRLGGRAWERGERRAEADQRVRVIHGVLAQDLGALEPVILVVDGKRVVDFVGRPDRLVFHTAPVTYRPLPYGAMVRRVSYFVEAGAGLVAHESYPLAERASATRRLDRSVVRIGFRYLAPPAPGRPAWRWNPTWEPRQIGGATAPGLGFVEARAGDDRISIGDFPLAVEITIALEADGRGQDLNLLVPIHVGRYL